MALVTSLWLGYSIYYPLRKLPIVDAVLRAGRARRALEREHPNHCLSTAGYSFNTGSRPHAVDEE